MYKRKRNIKIGYNGKTYNRKENNKRIYVRVCSKTFAKFIDKFHSLEYNSIC